MTKKSDLDFMDEIDAMHHRAPDRVAVMFLYVVLAFVISLFTWSLLTEVDEITQGVGTVIPSTNSQIVQSLEGGILQELAVQEGDLVKSGQVLMRLSQVAFASEEKGTQGKYLSLQARKSRLQAEANGAEFVIPDDIKEQIPSIAANEEKLFNSRQEEYSNALDMIDSKIKSSAAQIKELRTKISSGRESVTLINKELAITKKMVAMQAAPEIEEIRLARQLSEEQGKISAALDRITGLQSEINGAKQEKKDQKDRFKSQALGELNIVETEIASLSENLKTLGDRVDRTEIKSPVDGIVNNISLTTLGGVVEPAMRLAEIVPVNGDLKITAKVSPNDIAFLKVGQPAKVMITAYDSTRYGHLDGKLTRIGANSITGPDGKVNFEVEVQTDKNFLGAQDNALPITSGMIANIRIVTGKKTILEYFLKPFLRIKDQAFNER